MDEIRKGQSVLFNIQPSFLPQIIDQIDYQYEGLQNVNLCGSNTLYRREHSAASFGFNDSLAQHVLR